MARRLGAEPVVRIATPENNPSLVTTVLGFGDVTTRCCPPVSRQLLDQHFAEVARARNPYLVWLEWATRVARLTWLTLLLVGLASPNGVARLAIILTAVLCGAADQWLANGSGWVGMLAAAIIPVLAGAVGLTAGTADRGFILLCGLNLALALGRIALWIAVRHYVTGTFRQATAAA